MARALHGRVGFCFREGLGTTRGARTESTRAPRLVRSGRVVLLVDMAARSVVCMVMVRRVSREYRGRARAVQSVVLWRVRLLPLCRVRRARVRAQGSGGARRCMHVRWGVRLHTHFRSGGIELLHQAHVVPQHAVLRHHCAQPPSPATPWRRRALYASQLADVWPFRAAATHIAAASWSWSLTRPPAFARPPARPLLPCGGTFEPGRSEQVQKACHELSKKALFPWSETSKMTWSSR